MTGSEASSRTDTPADRCDEARVGDSWLPGFSLGVRRLVLAALAAFAYLPVVLDRPGQVAADTRQNMLLEPGTFLTRAVSMWDASSHLGTVTHQNIGLVFPMGSFFWVGDRLGLPIWLIQRIWLGSILFAAALGVLYLARTVAWRGAGPIVAAVVFMGTPYVLQYSSRVSALLLPWAALPWLIGQANRAIRAPGWRYPAAFAFVVFVVGSVNATTLLLVGLGPILWIVFAIWVYRLVTVRAGLVVVGRIALLCTMVSLWWLVALLIEARYGVDVLAFTETPREVATTSSAYEILRGLGYWLAYTAERFYANLSGTVPYRDDFWLLATSYVLPVLSLGAAFLVRWRYRAYFASLVVLGTVVGVGAHPVQGSSPFSAVVFRLASNSSVGLALRSTSRAVPLVVLGSAVLLGAAVTALEGRSLRLGLATATVLVAVAVVASPAVASGAFVDPNWDRPEQVPQYWRDAAAWVDANANGRRALEVPGMQFAAYRWGEAFEPITPGILRTPVVSRELQPYGSATTTDLLMAFDRRIQEGVLDPSAVSAFARLIGAGQVILRSDLAYERYEGPRPRAVWDLLTRSSTGLGAPKRFGAAVPNLPAPDTVPLVDEQTLGGLDGLRDPAPVAVFPVEDAPTVIRTVSARFPVLLAGDGEGVVDAAAAGLIDGRSLVLYAPSLRSDRATLRQSLRNDAVLVITDTNRRSERRWRSLRNSRGYVRAADESESDTGADFEVFADAGVSSQTVLERNGARVSGSRFADQETIEPGSRPALAFDGDTRTAWRIAPYEDHQGKHVTLRLDEPVTAASLTFVQPPGATVLVRSVAVRFDDGPAQVFSLDESSVTAPGQTLQFPERTFSRLDVEVRSVADTPEATVIGRSPYGFSEIEVPGVRVDEVVRIPDALLRTVGSRSDAHALAYTFTRDRVAPYERIRRDEERSLIRSFVVPDDREFALTGSVRLAANASDDLLDDVLGVGGSGAPRATSSSRLRGDAASRASAAIDGDPATAWQSAFDDLGSPTLTVELPAPITFDRLDLQIVRDGRHSVPSRLRIETEQGTRFVDIGAVPPDASGTTTVSFDPLAGSTLKVSVDAIAPLELRDTFTLAPKPQPVAIAELGIPGVQRATPAATLDECRDDLLLVDGSPVSVRVVGSTAALVAGRALSLESCSRPLTLAPGRHELRSAVGLDVGIDVDQIVLTSAPGGQAARIDSAGQPEVPRPGPVPAPKVVTDAATLRRVLVAPSSEPLWLVLSESRNAGWQARAVSGTAPAGAQLGASTLVNGFANGWYLGSPRQRVAVELKWRPQRAQTIALVVSFLAAAGCLLVAWRGRRRALPSTAGTAPVLAYANGATLSWRTAAVAAGVAGVAAAIAIRPWVGLAIAVLTLGASRARRGHLLLGLVTLALAVVGIGFFLLKRRMGPENGFYAFAALPLAHWLVLGAVLVLLADVVVEGLRSRAEVPVAAESAARSPRRTFTLVASLGAGLGAVGFLWMLTAGSFDLFAWQPLADFYDAQAHALLQGRLDLPAATLGIEGFLVGGKSYMYQGPTPALLRLPIALVTHDLDGRLTRLSMLVAFVLAVVGSLRILWRCRRAVRGDTPMSTLEAIAVGVWAFVLAGGSTLLFIASRSWVYHESLMWALACSILAFDAMLGYLERRTLLRLGTVTALATLALWSRASVGAGPVAALGLLFVLDAFRWWRARRDAARGTAPLRPVLMVLAAAAVPVVTYCAINVAKFGTLVAIPWDKQAYSQTVAERRAFLASSGGDFFGLQFVPQTLVRYLRPDAFSLIRVFPFIDFRPPPLTQVVGGVRFDTIDVSSSLTASLPFLLVLAGIGAWAVFRRASGSAAARLRIPALGALVGAMAIFPFGFVAHRYLGDWLPLLVVLVSPGIFVAVAWLESSRLRLVVGGSILAGLALWTVGANVAFALMYQRQYSNPTVGDAAVARFVDLRARIAADYGGESGLNVAQGDSLPASAPAGALFIVGDCDGLYLSDGLRTDSLKLSTFKPVERTEAVGAYDLRLQLDDVPRGTRLPLLAGGSADAPMTVWVERRRGDDVVFGYDGPSAAGKAVGQPYALPPGQRVRVEIGADVNLQQLIVTLEGRRVLETFYNYRGPTVVGRNSFDPAVEPRFLGSIQRSRHGTPVCRRIQARG